MIYICFFYYAVMWLLYYIFRYAIVWEKGYQEFETVESAVTSKLKGVTFTNHTGIDPKYQRVWDVADYVVPPQVLCYLVYYIK